MPEQAHPTARRAGRWLAGHQTAEAPGSRPSGRRKLLQGEFERFGGRAAQAPRSRAPARRSEQHFARLLGDARALGEQFEDGHHDRPRHRRRRSRRLVRFVERVAPLIELEQPGSGLQALRPVRRQVLRGPGLRPRHGRRAGGRDPG